MSESGKEAVVDVVVEISAIVVDIGDVAELPFPHLHHHRHSVCISERSVTVQTENVKKNSSKTHLSLSLSLPPYLFFCYVISHTSHYLIKCSLIISHFLILTNTQKSPTTIRLYTFFPCLTTTNKEERKS